MKKLILTSLLITTLATNAQDKLKIKDDRYKRPSQVLYGLDAEKKFQKLVTEDPKNFQGYYLLGDVAYLDKNYTKALGLFHKAYQREKKDYLLLYKMGLTHYRLKNYKKSLQFFKQALLYQKTKDPFFHLNKSFLHYALNDQGAHFAEKEKALSLAGNRRFDIHFLLGRFYFKQNNHQKALSALSQAQALAPKAPLPYFYLGYLELFQGQKKKAKSHLELYLKLTMTTKNKEWLKLRQEAQAFLKEI